MGTWMCEDTTGPESGRRCCLAGTSLSPWGAPHLHLDLLRGGGQVGSQKPVSGRGVVDVDGGVGLQHLQEEGGVHRGVGGEAGVQRVDDRRGAITEVPV